jgi:histidine triad (HIT) family protein
MKHIKKLFFVLAIAGIFYSFSAFFGTTCWRHNAKPAFAQSYDNDLITVTQASPNRNSYLIQGHIKKLPEVQSGQKKCDDVCFVDVDVQNPACKNMLTKMFSIALTLSEQHDNADFTMDISVKNGIVTYLCAYVAAQKPVMPHTCPFCTVTSLKGDMLYDDGVIRAFEKSRPARQPINFLIVPSKHVINYKDPAFTPDLFIKQLRVAQQFACKLVDPCDVKLHINNGPAAGQTVFHAHMHFKSRSAWR